MCRRRSSLLLGKCCQLVAPGTSHIISAAQAVIMLYTCQPFYASTSISSSLLLCLHCLRSSPRLTLPSSSDSTVVCPYHPPRTGIFCPSRRMVITARNQFSSTKGGLRIIGGAPHLALVRLARNTGRKNPTTKSIVGKKRRKWEVSETARTVFRIYACEKLRLQFKNVTGMLPENRDL